MPINSFLYPGAKVTPAYEVDNSVRIEYSDRYQCFTRTLGTPTDRKKFTICIQVKRYLTGKILIMFLKN